MSKWSRTEARKVLKRAKEALLTRGWKKGSVGANATSSRGVKFDSPVCILGAISVALNPTQEGALAYPVDLVSDHKVSKAIATEVLRSVATCIQPSYFQDPDGDLNSEEATCFTFNDRNETNINDVIAKIDCALSSLED